MRTLCFGWKCVGFVDLCWVLRETEKGVECGGLDLDVSFEKESLGDLCDGIGIVSSIQIPVDVLILVLVHKRECHVR